MRTAILLMAISSLSGCALFPSQVSVPKPPGTKANAGAKQEAATWKELQQHGKSLSVPPVHDIDELRAQIEVYATYWRDDQGELLLERDIAGRARDGAVLIAAYQAVKSQLKQARYSGIAAVLFGSYSDTYQVEVQAKNYFTAGQMMSCIREAVDKVPQEAWDYFTKKGEFDSSGITFVGGAADNLELLNDTFPAINRTMNRVLENLFKDQRELKLTGVDLEKLRAAYDKEKTALEKATAPRNMPSISGLRLRSLAAMPQQAQDDQAAARIVALKVLPANAEKCLGGV